MTPELKERSIAQLLANSHLTDPARELSRTAADLDGLIDTLLRKERLADATYAVAYRMPARLAVWWGCVSIELVSRCFPQCLRPLPEALASAVAWVVDPSESHRLAARKFGREIPYSNPHGPLTKAAGWGLDDDPDKYHGPDPCATHRAIGYSIKICSGKVLLPMVLATGLQMLEGRHHWLPRREAPSNG